MTNLPLEKSVILVRLNGIEGELQELQKLAATPFPQFSTGPEYKLAQYHLHRALEGVFNITSHILSRFPGIQASQYKELAVRLGELGIIDKDFASTKLVEMAKYRNRLVHFYAQITSQELYDIIKINLGDFDVFLSAIKKLLSNPQAFNLTVE